MMVYNSGSGVKLFQKTIFFLSMLIAVYGCYQYFSINSIYEFWYYGPLKEKGYDLQIWNSFRDGRPRISSVFTSSLEFSFFIVSCFFIMLPYCWFGVKRKSAKSKVLYCFSFFITCSFLFFVVLISTVRSAQVCLFGGLIYAVLLINLKSRISIFILGLLIFVGLSSLTFLYIGLGYTEELSAEGRVVQWAFVLGNLTDSIFGRGFSSIGPSQEIWFDSFWLNLIYSLGIIPVLFFFLMFYVFYKVVDVYVSSIDYSCFSFTALGFSSTILLPILLYASLFQAFYNSTVFYILCITCSVVIYGKNKIEN
ncbi:hypothetical protein [Halomonas citrativorans]|uniref:O-antigen polymerase n=1 Tax=Halomonas citrativorans TaxID=2742612 RepID=A0ABR9FEJ5_9GAMM|nr:hypothetical protein [Halomonas citrativorans]MBE0404479.1 hypothetical protein [Halomonas citrativorans]